MKAKAVLEDKLDLSIKLQPQNLERLLVLANRADKRANLMPPENGHTLAQAFSAVINGGDTAEIREIFTILASVEARPKDGWGWPEKEEEKK